ncbi:MAG: hypothetical protein JXA67_08210 [Micromonosporaceae bacterium]|nr:hypothetical protein [Micromonosporaceae bacterium]
MRSGRATASARGTIVGGTVGSLLAIALLLAPPMGTDLSAQVAHADFFQQYGFTPIDLRWYGGTTQYGYSWISPMIMAAVGVRLSGVLAVVVASIAFGALLARTGARRVALGAAIGAATFAGNLVSGRVTYAIGVAFALLALLALTRRLTRAWLAAGGLLAFLASAASPPAGAFLGLAGMALASTALVPVGPVTTADRRSARRRLAVSIVVAVGAGIPLGATALLASDGGVMNFGWRDASHAIVASLVVALLVRVPAVRIGALLSAAMVGAAYLVPSPVGLNSTRLAGMFALPLVAAFAEMPGISSQLAGWRATFRLTGWRAAFRAVWIGSVLAALAVWQPPVLFGDLMDAGNPTAERAYFTPLVEEISRRTPTGRVEIPPTRDYWEAAYVADAIPLARGWLRQIDLARNELFFGGTIGAEEYRAWLLDNGVAYVALPDAKLSWIGWTEAALIESRPPYLREVWRADHWTLFEVAGSPSIVEGATLIEATGDAVVFEAASPGDVLVRVTMSRWLRVRGPAEAAVREHGGWTAVSVAAAGRYILSSGTAQ